jgi:glucan phosphoethanolaminetransferase (alkaline phosphatase superfamily)
MVFFVALGAWLLPEAQTSAHKALSLDSFSLALWPVVAGILLALVAFALFRRKTESGIPSIPAGDLVAIVSWLAKPCQHMSQKYLGPGIQELRATLSMRLSPFLQVYRKTEFLWHMEKVLSSWLAVGTALLSMSVVFFLLLLFSWQ